MIFLPLTGYGLPWEKYNRGVSRRVLTNKRLLYVGQHKISKPAYYASHETKRHKYGWKNREIQETLHWMQEKWCCLEENVFCTYLSWLFFLSTCLWPGGKYRCLSFFFVCRINEQPLLSFLLKTYDQSKIRFLEVKSTILFYKRILTSYI